MKKWLKPLSLLMAGIMMFALAACSGSNSGSPTQAPATQAPTQAAATETATAAPDPTAAPANTEEEDIAALSKEDYGGRVFKIASWWKFGFETIDPEPDASDNNYLESLAKWNALQDFCREYNCTVQQVVVSWDDYVSTFTTSVMAGDPFADAVLLDAQWMVPIIQNDQIMTVEEWCPPDSDALTSQQWVKKGVEFDGKCYYLLNYDLPQGGALLGVNMDIINAIGAENPVDLYKNGQWTWDKLLEISRLATRATGSDGVINQWGLGYYASDLLTAMIASNDGSLVGVNGENGLADPKTLHAIEFWNQLYNEDKVCYQAPGVEWWDWGAHTNKFREGGVAFFRYIDWMAAASELSYEWRVVPFPKGPDNTANPNATWFKGLESALCVPRGVKDPTQVYTMLYKTYFDFFGDDYELKEEGCMNWFQTSCFTNQDDIDVNIAVSGSGFKYDLSGSIPGFDIGGWFIGPLLNGEMTPAQAIETNLQPAADAIANVFK